MLAHWTTNDDLLLKESIQTLGTFSRVARGVKVSLAVSLPLRWRALQAQSVRLTSALLFVAPVLAQVHAQAD